MKFPRSLLLRLLETLDEQYHDPTVQQVRKVYKANIGKETQTKQIFLENEISWTFFEIDQGPRGFDENNMMFTKPTDSIKYALSLVYCTFTRHWTKTYIPWKICFIMICPVWFLMQLLWIKYFIFYAKWYNLVKGP